MLCTLCPITAFRVPLPLFSASTPCCVLVPQPFTADESALDRFHLLLPSFSSSSFFSVLPRSPPSFFLNFVLTRPTPKGNPQPTRTLLSLRNRRCGDQGVEAIALSEGHPRGTPLPVPLYFLHDRLCTLSLFFFDLSCILRLYLRICLDFSMFQYLDRTPTNIIDTVHCMKPRFLPAWAPLVPFRPWS